METIGIINNCDINHKKQYYYLGKSFKTSAGNSKLNCVITFLDIFHFEI